MTKLDRKRIVGTPEREGHELERVVARGNQSKGDLIRQRRGPAKATRGAEALTAGRGLELEAGLGGAVINPGCTTAVDEGLGLIGGEVGTENGLEEQSTIGEVVPEAEALG
jgi:hypothetical protein